MRSLIGVVGSLAEALGFLAHVAEATDRLRDSELDAFDVAQVLSQYSRAASSQRDRLRPGALSEHPPCAGGPRASRSGNHRVDPVFADSVAAAEQEREVLPATEPDRHGDETSPRRFGLTVGEKLASLVHRIDLHFAGQVASSVGQGAPAGWRARVNRDLTLRHGFRLRQLGLPHAEQELHCVAVIHGRAHAGGTDRDRCRAGAPPAGHKLMSARGTAEPATLLSPRMTVKRWPPRARRFGPFRPASGS